MLPAKTEESEFIQVPNIDESYDTLRILLKHSINYYRIQYVWPG